MTFDRRWIVPALVVSAALLAGYTAAFRAVFTSRAPGANDFFSRWAGTRLWFARGWDPYGQETSLWIQNAIWGHPAGPDEDPSLFAYPFYTVFLVAPYALIGDYSWAQAAWQVTLQVVIVATLTLLLVYFNWRPKPIMLGTLILWVIFFYPAARSLILGQIGVIVFAFTVIAAWLLFRAQPSAARDAAAGVLLALTTVKPQMQFLVIPFLLLWSLRQRRFVVVAGFAVALAILLGASFLLLSSWWGEWLAQVINYPAYTPPAVLDILTHQMLQLGLLADAVEYALDAALLIYLFWEWRMGLTKNDSARLDWTIGLTLIVTHLVAPRTATTHFIVFVFPLIPMFRDWLKVPRWGAGIVYGAMLVLAVGMWALFLATLAGRQESDIVHVPLPLIMFALALVARGSLRQGAQELATL